MWAVKTPPTAICNAWGRWRHRSRRYAMAVVSTSQLKFEMNLILVQGWHYFVKGGMETNTNLSRINWQDSH